MTASSNRRADDSLGPPPWVRLALGGALALLLAGGLYLLAVRGPALLFDLAGTAAALLCL